MFLLNNKTHRMLVRYHPHIGHLFVPNQHARIPHERGGYLVRTNSQGFRSDREFIPAKGDRPRILVFGDSMTAGDGCSNAERYSERLGEMLNAEVYNFGLSGSGTDQQLLIFEEFAREIEADLIVLGVFVENIERIQRTARPIADRTTGETVLVPKPYFELTPDSTLTLKNSPVPLERVPVAKGWREFNGIGDKSLAWAVRFYKQLRANQSGAGGQAHKNSRGRFLDLPLLRNLRRIIAPTGIDELSPLRPALQRMLGYNPYHQEYADPKHPGGLLMEAIIRRWASKLDCPMVLMPLPKRFMFLSSGKRSYTNFYSALANDLDNLHFVDVTTPLQALPFDERKRVCFPMDAHFSPRGHERVADILADEIRIRGLLPMASEPTRPVAASPSPATQESPRPATSKGRLVLGISCFYHNAGAALIRDGQVIAAAEEERFTRVKNDRRFPSAAINFCLEQGSVDSADLDAVAYYDIAELTFERLLRTVAHSAEQGRPLWQRMMPSWLLYKLRFPEMARRSLRHDVPVLRTHHHRSHAASAFFASPFEKAAVLTIDGVGEWATSTIGYGDSSGLRLLREIHFPHSLGLLYTAFTVFTGFRANSGEYKMMGLAPYGEPRFKQIILDELIDLKVDGSLELNLDYFSFVSEEGLANDRFAELFEGGARAPEARITQRERDIARSIQEVTEEAMLLMAHHVAELTGAKSLCMAGGVALNCVANGRILREGPFDNVWIQPAAGDSGGAMGAALDAYHSWFKQPRDLGSGEEPQQGSLWGPEFSDDEVCSFLETFGYPYERIPAVERADRLAGMLADGQVIGHFSGRSEFGPRSLGARSILGDARDPEMQVKLNLKVKYRESFRPFAPAVLAAKASEYFELEGESPYMQIVAAVQKPRRLPFERNTSEDLLEVVRQSRSDIPAVTHVDYSARIQTVKRKHHPRFFGLLEAFERRTGTAVLVNTSFNVRGEPIVNTPEDAYRCFMHTEMDALVLNDFLLLKTSQPAVRKTDTSANGTEVIAAMQPHWPPGLLKKLDKLFDATFLPAITRNSEYAALSHTFRSMPTVWQEATPELASYAVPEAFYNAEHDPTELAKILVAGWRDAGFAHCMLPTVTEMLKLASNYSLPEEDIEQVSNKLYVMF